MRWNASCPDCGQVITEAEYYGMRNGFDCPRCKCHYATQDFEEHLDEKHMAQHHNHAKADLTQEEQD